MEILIITAKDLVVLLWNIFLATILLWLLSHMIMSIIKTLFCDIELKLYRTWKKKLKSICLTSIISDDEIKKYLNELKKSEKV